MKRKKENGAEIVKVVYDIYVKRKIVIVILHKNGQNIWRCCAHSMFLPASIHPIQI